MSHRNPKAAEYDIDRAPCKFGNVTVGPEKCSIGVVTDRKTVRPSVLDRVVCGARVQAILTFDPGDSGDVEGQRKLIETQEVRVDSVADCPSVGLRPDRCSFRLSFAVESVDIGSLAATAQRAGWVSLKRIGDSGDDGDDGDAGDE